MNKGVFFIPIYKQNKPYYEIIDEVIQSTINCEKNGMEEAFFGEHLTDRHEKISSSLMMIASLAKLTKKIKLGSLTTNLNYYNPALVAGLISTVDNMTKGRLILGIGSGTNATDIEALGLSEKNNYSINTGVIGLGVGMSHAEIYEKSKKCKLIFLCDFNKKFKHLCKKKFKCNFTTNANKLLKHNNIDLISIASFDNYHSRQIISSIKTNKHIFVEKPLSDSSLKCQELIDLADLKKLVLFLIFKKKI